MESGGFSWVRSWKRELESKGWWHSFELPDGRSIQGVCTEAGLRQRLNQFPIPQDLGGARVLDIGAWDGWYSFEMERRGADVVAVDCWDNPRFHQVHAALNSRVEYRQMDVYELAPETVGRFDIVLFMGVLYHLKHPLLALERVCAITKELAAVDSFILREEHRPGENVENRVVMEFYESEEFGGQMDNWCGPSLPCLMAMCRTAGFARVEHCATLPDGACIACYRKWKPSSHGAGSAPRLLDAFHHTNFGINFCTKYDEYVSASFRTSRTSLTIDQIETQAGGYGVRPAHLSRKEAGVWTANFKLPPGLAPGWHPVVVRIEGAESNAKQIAVDLALPEAALEIRAVCDGATWQRDILDLAKGDILVAWVAGLPRNADRANVRALLGGERVPVQFVGVEEGQVNIQVPAGAPAGYLNLEILIGANRSSPAPVKITC